MTSDVNSSCECGALRARVSAEPAFQLCCHCSDCQSATSLPYASIVFFRKDQVAIEGDFETQEFVAESGSETFRDSCRQCGTVMFDRSAGFPTLFGIMAARIAEPFSFEPACHTWTKSKQEGIEIPEETKAYEKGIT